MRGRARAHPGGMPLTLSFPSLGGALRSAPAAAAVFQSRRPDSRRLRHPRPRSRSFRPRAHRCGGRGMIVEAADSDTPGTATATADCAFARNAWGGHVPQVVAPAAPLEVAALKLRPFRKLLDPRPAVREHALTYAQAGLANRLCDDCRASRRRAARSVGRVPRQAPCIRKSSQCRPRGDSPGVPSLNKFKADAHEPLNN